MIHAVDKSSLSTRLIALLTVGCTTIGAACSEAGVGTIVQPSAVADEAAARVRASLGETRQADDETTPRLHVEAQAPDPRLRLPACMTLLDSRIETDRLEHGRALVRVACPQPAWSVFVPVRIETETDVLVASRPLPRGSTLAASDVRLERRRFLGVTESYVKSLAELSRYRLRRPLAPGALLARDALEPAPAVQRGSLVTLRAEAGGFRIDAAGRAMADAAPGQRVRVQNLASLKIVEGMVDAAGIVRLDP